MHSLAAIYQDQNQWEEAEQLQVQVIEARKTKLRENHPVKLMNVCNFACIWKLSGRNAEVMNMMRYGLVKQKRILSLNHQHALNICDAFLAW